MGKDWNADALRGTRLGSCVIEEPIGFGGMSAVYLAQQERPRRHVAVKVLHAHAQSATDASAWNVFLARFRREADATAALDHANIVPIYEFGEVDTLAYLVMPYLADGSLATLLQRNGTLPLMTVVRYIEQVAAALDYAHQHGIVHRDVKPSNILLHPDGRLMLADFGIARPLGRRDGQSAARTVALSGTYVDDATLTQMGAAMGTPEYMAPEVVRGDAVGAAADIYALGIAAYVMLSGRSPFAGGDTAAVLTRQLSALPLPLRTEQTDIPAKAEEAVFLALAKDPTGRPPTAGAFAQLLREASRGRTLGSLLGWAKANATQDLSDMRLGLVGESTDAAASVHTAYVAPRLRQGTMPLPQAAQRRSIDASGLTTSGASTPAGARGSGSTGTASWQHTAQDEPTLGALWRGAADGTTEGAETTSNRDATRGGFVYPAANFGVAAGDNVAGMGVGIGAGHAPPRWPVLTRSRGEGDGKGGSKGGSRSGGASGASGASVADRWPWLMALLAVAVALFGTLLLISTLNAHGFFAGVNPNGHSASSVLAHPSPTATPTPTALPTPTVPPNWLRVSVTSVTLGCKKNDNSAKVTLSNVGASAVEWHAHVSQMYGVNEVAVSPTSGKLDPGHTATLTISNTFALMSREGAVTVSATGAGDPATVAFSAAGCFNSSD